jgi:DNA-binding LacI/PurR family transcriptional regulator
VSPVLAEATRALGAHLRALGHVRVAVVRREPRVAALQAIGAGLHAHGLVVEAAEASEADGMRGCLAALMARPDRPTAVIAGDPHSRGLIAACEAAGLAAPDALSIVSLSEIAAEGYHRRHAISAVTIDPACMGRAAAATMLASLAGDRPDARIAVEAAAFTPRGTTGPAPF